MGNRQLHLFDQTGLGGSGGFRDDLEHRPVQSAQLTYMYTGYPPYGKAPVSTPHGHTLVNKYDDLIVWTIRNIHAPHHIHVPVSTPHTKKRDSIVPPKLTCM